MGRAAILAVLAVVLLAGAVTAVVWAAPDDYDNDGDTWISDDEVWDALVDLHNHKITVEEAWDVVRAYGNEEHVSPSPTPKPRPTPTPTPAPEECRSVDGKLVTPAQTRATTEGQGSIFGTFVNPEGSWEYGYKYFRSSDGLIGYYEDYVQITVSSGGTWRVELNDPQADDHAVFTGSTAAWGSSFNTERGGRNWIGIVAIADSAWTDEEERIELRVGKNGAGLIVPGELLGWSVPWIGTTSEIVYFAGRATWCPR